MTKLITKFSGQSRVVVDKVSPALGAEYLPVKRIIGEGLVLNVHAIADGHDQIDVIVRYRKLGDQKWDEHKLNDLGNDEFSGEINPEEIGLYEYGASAWIDPFHNWHVGFVKKADSNDPKIEVELQIGLELLRDTLKRAKGADKKRILNWAEFIGDDKRDLEQRIQLVCSHEFYSLIRNYPNRSFETQSDLFLLSVERERAVFSTWYEYFPRSCAKDESKHGTFKDAENRLDEIERMGFDIVYFPPVHPIGRLHRKGKNNSLIADEKDVGSPWAIGAKEGGHKSIHPELGTLDDFKSFIAKAERKGMEVAMDIAFQCAPDHPYVKEHPDWFKWRPDGTVQYAENPPKKYQDILPFDFETKDWKSLWLELKSIFDYWIDVGVKIFRVDNPHTKPLEFWRWCILEIKKEHPEVLFLAEAFTRPKRKYRLGKAGFTQGYTYFTWRNFAEEMREYVEELTQSEVKDYFYPNFWPNTPDILHEDLQKGTRATYVGRYLLAATLSSNTGIYGPAFEVMDSEPFPGKEEYNNNEKYQLKNWNWDSAGNIKREIGIINGLRRSYFSLQRLQNIKFVETENEKFLAYLKYDLSKQEVFLIVVNMDWYNAQSGHVFMPIEFLGYGSDKEYQITDLLDSKETTYTWRGVKNFVKLDPNKAAGHFFKIKFS